MTPEGQPIDINQYRARVQEKTSFKKESPYKSELPYQREVVGSRAFNLEYFTHTSDSEMYDDVVSYLGEYRFKLQEFKYEMVFAQGEDGKFAIRDTARGESLHVKTKRVLEERVYRGDLIHRELQEEASVRSLDQQLLFAKTGDKLRWVSPPGPKDQGYGSYGFFYEGEIEKNNDGSAALHMNAIRVDSTDLNAYNTAFNALTGDTVSYADADDFLGDARVVRGTPAEKNIEEVLRENFGFKTNDAQNQDFAIIIARVQPLIREVIHEIKYGSSKDKVTSFHTLENYFLKQKEALEEERASGGKLINIEVRRTQSLQSLKDRYGHEPPKAGGSCGSTEETSGLAIGGGKEADILMQDEFGSLEFSCPDCNRKNVRPRGKLIASCQYIDCGSTNVACKETKEEAPVSITKKREEYAKGNEEKAA